MKLTLRSAAPGIFALGLLFACQSVFAETPSQIPPESPTPTVVYTGGGKWTEPRKVVRDFFSRLKSNNVDEAYDELLKGTKIAESAKDVSMLKAKTREALQLGGAIEGNDLIATKEAGEHLVSLTYLSLGKTYPLRWRFYFYKASDQWKLIDIRISDRLAEMLGEQGAAAETAP